MPTDPANEFLSSLSPVVEPVAQRLVAVIVPTAAFDLAIKWRQLTFALDGDFDNWLCAVAATPRQARLTFHFGAWLDAPARLFEESDAKFVRKIAYNQASDIDDAVVRPLLAQALELLPTFRATR